MATSIRRTTTTENTKGEEGQPRPPNRPTMVNIMTTITREPRGDTFYYI